MHDRWLAWNGAALGQAEFRLLWARYHLELGELEQAHEQARAALDHATNPRQPLSLIAAHRLLGRLATRRGAFEEAAEHLSTALDSATTCELPYERALTQLAQAELAIATNVFDLSRELLISVRTACEPLDAKRALAHVAELEGRLNSASHRTRYPAGLTQREVDVLRLVAGGLTDVEVANELYLSPRTVSSYLSSVFNKLGVNSRTAAAAFAIREGLV
jgi:DNA-binding CsgD family transcriptional regulator